MARFVIFDIDGTLVDSVDLHARAWQEAFRHFGKEVPVDDLRQQIGKGGDQLLPVFFTREELDRLGKELEQYRADLFKREYLPRVHAFPRVRDLFERVKADKKRIALASSAKKEELEALKKIANVEGLADAETCSDDIDRSKPHADVFHAVLEALGGPAPAEGIAVGDTPYDAEAAGKAGLGTVGIVGGAFSAEELRAAGCVAVYREPADLLRHYDRSPLADSTLA